MAKPTLAEQSAVLDRVLESARNAEKNYSQFQAGVRNDTINRLRAQRRIGAFINNHYRMLTTGMIQRHVNGKWHDWYDGSKGGQTPWIAIGGGFPSQSHGTLIGGYNSAFRYKDITKHRVAIDMVVCPHRRPDPDAPKDYTKYKPVTQGYLNGVFNGGNGYRRVPWHDSINMMHPIAKYMKHPSTKHRYMWHGYVWVRFVTRRNADGKYNAITFKDCLNHPNQHTFFRATELEMLLNS